MFPHASEDALDLLTRLLQVCWQGAELGLKGHVYTCTGATANTSHMLMHQHYLNAYFSSRRIHRNGVLLPSLGNTAFVFLAPQGGGISHTSAVAGC